MGTKHICLPFPSEAQYRAYPELFPKDMDQGCTLYDAYMSIKQDLIVRRIKVKATGAVFAMRPSFIMPSLITRTEEVEKALYLRQWGVPLEALAYVFGRDAMF
jgi:hypothetical protein